MCHNVGNILIYQVGKVEREIVVYHYIVIVKEGTQHRAEWGVHSTDDFFFLDPVGYVQVLILATNPPGRACIRKPSHVHQARSTS